MTAYDFQPQIYFYSMSLPLLQSSGIDSITTSPAVLVFKDGTHYVYPYEKEKSEALQSRDPAGDEVSDHVLINPELNRLRDWVNHERFPSVVQISNGNFHQVMKIKKFIVLAILEEDKVGRMSKAMREYVYFAFFLIINECLYIYLLSHF